ncbi:unnamed protein product [Auanema sp. JU1783]|nr:unnamed protein product [Auanema sp. JU1783]
MLKYNFLAIPQKTTNEVDLATPLASYIDSVYNTNDDNKPEITEAVQELNKLRSRAVVQPLDRHQSGLDVITRYYDQLVAIENKIVISPTQNPVVFKWRDAFYKGGLFSKAASLSIADGAFERGCVLFNCGSLYSQVAADQPMNTDDEMKTAAKLFQQAAGVFAQLRDTIFSLVQQDPTPDLSPETLSCLVPLLIAQAQECIYIKASKDNMKPGALAKIAAYVSDMYTDAHKAMTKDAVRGIWEKEWTATVNGKSLAYQALMHYHQGALDREENKIGSQISRLTESLKIIEISKKYFSSEFLDTSMKNVQQALKGAQKDNEFIYHDKVPDFKNLPAVPRAALAKALPLSLPLSPRFKDMFVNLVPVQVLNAMQAYQGRKGEIVNLESGRLREHTQLLNGILASLNLPAALDDMISSDTLPESIKEKSSKVKQSGGHSELLRLFNDLPSLFKRNQEILDETNKSLTEEKESDDNLRRQFGTKWSRMSSDQLTSPLIQEIGKYRGIMHTASNADKMVREKFDANSSAIEMLSKSEPELKSCIPGQQSDSVHGTSEAVQKLRNLMNQVQGIKNTRESIEKDLKSTDCNIANDFMKALSESQLLNEESISKEKINQLFSPLKEKVNASIKEQENVLAEVEKWNNVFSKEKSGNASGAERERILKQLAAGFDVFNELKSNLEEGTKFYNDLTPILVRLQQKVNDFVFARQTEKEDLMKQVQQNIVSGGAPTSAVPPPRPPPPRPQNPTTPTVPPRGQSTGAPSAPATAPQVGNSGDANFNQNNFMPPTPQQPPYFQQQFPYGQPQPYYAPPPQYNYPTYPGAFQNQYNQGYGQFPPMPNYGNQMPPQQYQQPPAGVPPQQNPTNPFYQQ